jgi:hypothetical protein
LAAECFDKDFFAHGVWWLKKRALQRFMVFVQGLLKKWRKATQYKSWPVFR